METRVTRRRFLRAVGAGATYLALTNTVGCKQLGYASKVSPLNSPELGSLRIPRKSRPLTGIPSTPAKGAWDFHSRPDLNPPAVEVAEQAHGTAPGYIFIAPESGGAAQGGSMILDDRGQVVWFRPLPDAYGRAMNFEVQTYRGHPVLTSMETPGQHVSEYVIFDDSYQELARFGAAHGYDGDHHEFHISPQDTALITIVSAVRRDLSSIGGPKDGLVWQGVIQELDIETKEVIFEWKSIDHVGLDETYVTPAEDHYPGIDYFHINSIDVDHDDNLLISARETSTVYKIDRKTGEIIWRLGGKKSDFQMEEGARFAYQHDARRLPDGNISIFDNGSLVFENGTPKAVEESRAIVLEVDEERMRAKLVGEYTHPDKQYADAAGNTQVLPNGNVFVGWGRALAISEFSNDGELLFDFRLSPENKSYRAFRFGWSGKPSDRPSAVAERTSEDEVRVYASWNGATEVESWEVLAGKRAGRLKSLGSIPKEGFETAMVVRTSDPYLAVRAKDGKGGVLDTSEPVET